VGCIGSGGEQTDGEDHDDPDLSILFGFCKKKGIFSKLIPWLAARKKIPCHES
jgi:hypothetical protein